jgi:hypothetical protein
MEKTPRIARSTVATDPATAGPQDDFGYTDTWQRFQDNRRYDPVSGEDKEIPE